MALARSLPVHVPPIPTIDRDDPAAAADALERTGAVVVRRLIPPAVVDALSAEVRRAIGDPGAACSRYDMAFVERSPTLLAALEDGAVLAIAQALVGARELAINRSAAIVRIAGSVQVGWHSDFDGGTGAPTSVDGVLNRDPSVASLWFYLTGCRPDHGGLWVIPGSHRPGWLPQAPYGLSADGRVIVGPDASPPPLAMPEAVPVEAAPGDLVAFAARTYHAAAPLAQGMRLSCGIGLRPRATRLAAPWPLPAETQAWLAGVPARLRPLVDGYVGIDPGWTPPERGSR